MVFRTLLIFLFAVSFTLSSSACVATPTFYKNESALNHTLKIQVKGFGPEIILTGRAVGTTRDLPVGAVGAVRDLAAKALIGARARWAKLKARPRPKPKPRRNLSDGGEFDGPALRMGEQPFVSKSGSGANRALHEKYVDGLRQQMSKPHTSNSQLTGLLDDLYRPNAKIGSGSTADAVRHELSTGGQVGGRLHTQKAQDGIRSLQKWLSKNPKARPGDRAAAENVIRDMQNALRGN